MNDFKLINLSGLQEYDGKIKAWVKAIDDLTNYYTKTTTYTKTEVDALLSAIKSGSFIVVSTLPEASASTVGNIYLVKPTGATSYEEYITINTGTTETPSYSWEKIGDTDIKLANYYTKSETDSEISDAVAPFKNEGEIKEIIEDYGYETVEHVTTKFNTVSAAAAAAQQAADDAQEDATQALTDAAAADAKADAAQATADSKYLKPNTGIPSSDMSSAVQASLALADSALQATDLIPYRTSADQDVIDNAAKARLSAIEAKEDGWDAKYDLPFNGIPANHMSQEVQTSLALADSAVQDEDYVHTDNNYTSAEKTKLGNIEAGAEVNVLEGIKIGTSAESASTMDITNKIGFIDIASNSDIDGLFD